MEFTSEIKYGNGDEELIRINSLADDYKLNLCMRLYKSFNTIEELEKVLPKEILKKVNEIY